jgi:uncharacterized protein (DUF1778 family)
MNGSNRNREERISAYVDPETAERIKSAADREGRSLSSYVAQLLKRQMEVERRLYDPAPTVQEPHR